MSNMLYACSILYKTRLPCILAFNKTDVLSHAFAIEWMTDYEAFQDAVDQEKSYMGSLVRSMALVLDEVSWGRRDKLGVGAGACGPGASPRTAAAVLPAAPHGGRLGVHGRRRR